MSIKPIILWSVLCAAIPALGPAAESNEPFNGLRVSQNQRFLEYQDGTPFFYLGDTAWELFHRLNREEADHYLRHNSVWQMWQPGRNPVIGASTPWREALDFPGASQMKHVRRLFESRPFSRLVPDQSIILDGPSHGGAKIRAARASDGSFAFVYSPRGEQFTVRVNVIRTSRIRQTWFDPRTGIATVLHTTDTPGFQTFVPPTHGRGNDWILVLDGATAGFPLPGESRK